MGVYYWPYQLKDNLKSGKNIFILSSYETSYQVALNVKLELCYRRIGNIGKRDIIAVSQIQLTADVGRSRDQCFECFVKYNPCFMLPNMLEIGYRTR